MSGLNGRNVVSTYSLRTDRRRDVLCLDLLKRVLFDQCRRDPIVRKDIRRNLLEYMTSSEVPKKAGYKKEVQDLIS